LKALLTGINIKGLFNSSTTEDTSSITNTSHTTRCNIHQSSSSIIIIIIIIINRRRSHSGTKSNTNNNDNAGTFSVSIGNVIGRRHHYHHDHHHRKGGGSDKAMGVNYNTRLEESSISAAVMISTIQAQKMRGVGVAQVL
jgi:hypothetical protein